ncbi:MAG TPA: DUF2089 domain-containing protein [Myxococcales bacterium]|nr:DUF2089 domain-containing protein [Myxococcales bacterium]
MDLPAQALPGRCPFCSGPTLVEKVRCRSCGTAVEGRFSLDWLEAVSREQLSFIKVFLTCRGKIKDVEQALGISYPTVVSRLDDLVAAIGGTPPPPGGARAAQREKILDDLQAGAIDADEAARLLREV